MYLEMHRQNVLVLARVTGVHPRALRASQKRKPQISIGYKIIVVNDLSTDQTRAIVERLTRQYDNVTLVNRKGNHGLGRCITRGFEELDDGYVVIVMADLADDVSDIPKMAAELDKGFDLVCGSRYKKGGSANHHLKLKGFLSRLLGRALRILTGIPIHDPTNAFKMYRTGLLDKIGILRSDNYASGLEVLVKAYCLGYKVTEIPTVWKDRSFGSSHFRILKVAPEYIHWTLWAIFKTWRYRLFGKR